MTNLAISAQERDHLLKKLEQSRQINGPTAGLNNSKQIEDLDRRRGLQVSEGTKSTSAGNTAILRGKKVQPKTQQTQAV